MDTYTEDNNIYSQPQQPTVYKEHRSGRILKIAGLALVAVVLVAGVLAGIVATRNEATNQVSAASKPAATVIVSTGGNFSPDTIKVKKGQGVTWTSSDGRYSHKIVAASDDASASLKGFGSQELLGKTNSYSYVFEQVGTYYYYDTSAETNNVGTVIVTE